MRFTLLPKGKNDKWLVKYSNEEVEHTLELESKGKVFIKLLSLREQGVDMSSIVIYAPQSNLTYEQFLIS